MAGSTYKARMLEAFRFRMFFFAAVVAFFFLILLVQLVNLQLINGTDYKIKSRNNMENNIPIPASRGHIYDRWFEVDGDNNTVVASNRPSFNITTIPARFGKRKEGRRKFRLVLKRLSRLLDLDYAELLRNQRGKDLSVRIVIKEDVTLSEVTKIASHPDIFPNIDWEDAPVRVYNKNNVFSHVIGYIGSINKKEYKRLKVHGYKYYQKIGKTGLEKQYDQFLRGKDGFIRRIVDVKKRTEGEEIGLYPESGNNLILSLDAKVQQVAFDALGSQRGTVVVIKPSTGEVISMVSKPDFDPNQIISRDNAQLLKLLFSDKDRPFLNRAIQAKYPPASTFKLVTAIAALESEKSFPMKKFFCSGKYTLKGAKDKDFYCYKAHGQLNLYHAIGKSCSSYFYQLGYLTGPTNILKYANYFGLNKKTDIDLPSEVSGFVPSKKWKLRRLRESWYDGDTINLSIGQGFLHLTPIAMANFVCGLVNNGIIYKPRVVKSIRSADNSVLIKKIEKEKLREVPLSPKTLLAVKQGMRYSVTNGTSARLKYLKIPVAGKTGTAQTRSVRNADKTQHAWFVGYAPFGGDPEKSVAIAVLVEHGIAGAVAAVPIAEKVLYKLNELGYFK